MKKYITYNQLKNYVFESVQSQDQIIESVIKERGLTDLINGFIQNIGSTFESRDISEAEETIDLDTINLKDELHQAIANIKTKEDFIKFMDEYDAKVKEFQKDEKVSSQAKAIIMKIWEKLSLVASYILQGVTFVSDHWKLILFLAGVITICCVFHIGPLQALKFAWTSCIELAKSFYSFLKATKWGRDKVEQVIDVVKDEINNDFEYQVELRHEHPWLAAIRDTRTIMPYGYVF